MMTNDKIFLGAWSGEIIISMMDFRNYWYAHNAKHPEDFPPTLTREDWEDEFNSFQASRKALSGEPLVSVPPTTTEPATRPENEQ
jgi:hypothetical protein